MYAMAISILSASLIFEEKKTSFSNKNIIFLNTNLCECECVYVFICFRIIIIQVLRISFMRYGIVVTMKKYEVSV